MTITATRHSKHAGSLCENTEPTIRLMLRLAGLLVTILLLTAACSSVDPNATAPEVFEQTCARCHGISMAGGTGPALGPGSAAQAKPDESLLTAITNGRARMPSFRNQLTEAQIRGLVQYIRAVQADG